MPHPRVLLACLPFLALPACGHEPSASVTIPTATATATPTPTATSSGEEGEDAPGNPTPPAGVDTDSVREAVFRHLFGKNASGAQQSAQVFCLSVEGGKDPSAALLARFSKSTVPVVAASGCTADPRTGVHQKGTGRKGLVFRIDSIGFVKPDVAMVEGGYYEAGLSASGNTYTVEHKGGAWTVTKDVMRWIS